MTDLPNLKAAAIRHTRPGSIALMAFALLLFGPRIWDTVRGEPWIDSRLAVIETSTGNVIVEEHIRTNQPVHGRRYSSAEAEDGTVICSEDVSATWIGTTARFWRIDGFAGCLPQEPFRVCSSFALYSDSGRNRHLGPFCSPFGAASISAE